MEAGKALLRGSQQTADRGSDRKAEIESRSEEPHHFGSITRRRDVRDHALHDAQCATEKTADDPQDHCGFKVLRECKCDVRHGRAGCGQHQNRPATGQIRSPTPENLPGNIAQRIGRNEARDSKRACTECVSIEGKKRQNEAEAGDVQEHQHEQERQRTCASFRLINRAHRASPNPFGRVLPRTQIAQMPIAVLSLIPLR